MAGTNPVSLETYQVIRKSLRSKKQRLLFDLLWWTGAKIGAACRLKVTDVYSDNLSPREQIRFGDRAIPVHPRLKELLEAYQPSLESCWLFPARLNPEKPLEPSGASWYLLQASQKAGIGHVTSHSFRESFCYRLAQRGTDCRVVQQLTGYQSLSALQRFGRTTNPETLKKAIANL